MGGMGVIVVVWVGGVVSFNDSERFVIFFFLLLRLVHNNNTLCNNNTK